VSTSVAGGNIDEFVQRRYRLRELCGIDLHIERRARARPKPERRAERQTNPAVLQDGFDCA
jgi:hypothetical protein